MSGVGAAIAGVGAVAGAVISSDGARSASNAQSRSSDAAIAEQQRQFDTLLSLTAPQRAIGNQALATLGGIYGYSPTAGPLPAPGGNQLGRRPGFTGAYGGILGGRPMQRPDGRDIRIPANPGRAPVTINGATGQVERPNYNAFFESPDYNFRLNEGRDFVQNSAAAAGGLYSGNTYRALSDYGQNTAAGEFGNWFSRQAALAGIGQAATSQAGNAALTTGANVGNLMVNQGNARASGIIGQTNSMTNLINQLSTLWGSGAFGGSGLPGSTYQPTWTGVPA